MKGYKFDEQVAHGDNANTAAHIYNIVKNPNYNIWTDPYTGHGQACNDYEWDETLLDAVRKIDPEWIEKNRIDDSDIEND